MATDLVSALFAHLVDDPGSLPPETRRRTLVLRVHSFIRAHLSDPDLTPGGIAAAHHISISYPHRLFQDDRVPVSAWIRRLRLENARRDLADPVLRAVGVHEVAARWGFRRRAVFTRAFRAAYGMSPKDYRHRETGAL